MSGSRPAVLLAVDLVILTLRGSCLQVLLVKRGVEPYRGAMALPGGFLNNAGEDILTRSTSGVVRRGWLDAVLLASQNN